MRISDWSSDVCFPICFDREVAARRCRPPDQPEGDRGIETACREQCSLKQHVETNIPSFLFGGVDFDPVAPGGHGALMDADADAVTHDTAGEQFEALKMIRRAVAGGRASSHSRSEEHTSELQSLMRSSYAVFCLKKKKATMADITT